MAKMLPSSPHNTIEEEDIQCKELLLVFSFPSLGLFAIMIMLFSTPRHCQCI
jgi:hypothetical protein